MKNNTKVETRIQKYSELRKKIDQEIRNLKLKNENDAKLNYYRDILEKIDVNIFREVNKKTEELFPNLKTLIQAGKKTQDDDLQNKKSEIKKWTEIIDVTTKNDNDNKTLEDYVPDSNNEQFVKNIAQNWEKQRSTQVKQFRELIKIKEQFSEQKIDKNALSKELDILQEVHKVNSQIEKYNASLQKIIQMKKNRSRKWFWIISVITVFLIVCLILIFVT